MVREEEFELNVLEIVDREEVLERLLEEGSAAFAINLEM